MRMNRRTSLRTIFAASLATAVRLRPEVPREALLRSFCGDPDYGSWNLDEPIGVGSLTYATDARAIARCEIASRLDVGERRLPPVDRVWGENWRPVGGWVPIESVYQGPTEFKEFMCCPACGDRRVSLGEFYPDHSDEALAAEHHRLSFDVDDNTIRDVSCWLCHGLVYCGPNVALTPCGVHSAWMLSRIAAIPDVRVCRSGVNENLMLFSGSGFQGMSLGCGEFS
jgi:hypothetical protein